MKSGQLKFIEPVDGVPFGEGINIRYVYGHTDAMYVTADQL